MGFALVSTVDGWRGTCGSALAFLSCLKTDMILVAQFIAAKKAELEEKQGNERKLQDTMIRSAQGRAQASDSFEKRRVSLALHFTIWGLIKCRIRVRGFHLDQWGNHPEVLVIGDGQDRPFAEVHLPTTVITGIVVGLLGGSMMTERGIEAMVGGIQAVDQGVEAGVPDGDMGIVGAHPLLLPVEDHQDARSLPHRVEEALPLAGDPLSPRDVGARHPPHKEIVVSPRLFEHGESSLVSQRREGRRKALRLCGLCLRLHEGKPKAGRAVGHPLPATPHLEA